MTMSDRLNFKNITEGLHIPETDVINICELFVKNDKFNLQNVSRRQKQSLLYFLNWEDGYFTYKRIYLRNLKSSSNPKGIFQDEFSNSFLFFPFLFLFRINGKRSSIKESGISNWKELWMFSMIANFLCISSNWISKSVI